MNQPNLHLTILSPACFEDPQSDQCLVAEAPTLITHQAFSPAPISSSGNFISPFLISTQATPLTTQQPATIPSLPAYSKTYDYTNANTAVVSSPSDGWPGLLLVIIAICFITLGHHLKKQRSML